MEPHQKRISMSNKITRNFKIGTLHIIAIYLLASQKTNSLNTGRPRTEGHRNDLEQSDTLLGGNDLEQNYYYYGSDTNTY